MTKEDGLDSETGDPALAAARQTIEKMRREAEKSNDLLREYRRFARTILNAGRIKGGEPEIQKELTDAVLKSDDAMIAALSEMIKLYAKDAEHAVEGLEIMMDIRVALSERKGWLPPDVEQKLNEYSEPYFQQKVAEFKERSKITD